MIFARAYFVNVHHFRGFRGNKLTIMAGNTAAKTVCKISGVTAILP